MTNTQLVNALREREVAKLLALLLDNDYEMAGLCHSNKICFPTLDAEGNERDIVITVSVPKGDFDSCFAIQDYKEQLALKAEKAEAKAKAKAEKAKAKA